MTNSADPDQLASSEANWSGSTLLAKTGHIVFSKRRVKDSLQKFSRWQIDNIFLFFPDTENCNPEDLQKLHNYRDLGNTLLVTLDLLLQLRYASVSHLFSKLLPVSAGRRNDFSRFLEARLSPDILFNIIIIIIIIIQRVLKFRYSEK